MDLVNTQNGFLSKKVALYPGRGGSNLPSLSPAVEGDGTVMAILQNMQVTMNTDAVGKAFSMRTESPHLMKRYFDKRSELLFFFFCMWKLLFLVFPEHSKALELLYLIYL